MTERIVSDETLDAFCEAEGESTTTDRLDRAIAVAEHKVRSLYNQKQKRRFARALIAAYLSAMPEDEWRAIGGSYARSTGMEARA